MTREQIKDKISKLEDSLKYAEDSLEKCKELGCGDGMLSIFEDRIPSLRNEIDRLEKQLFLKI